MIQENKDNIARVAELARRLYRTTDDILETGESNFWVGDGEDCPEGDYYVLESDQHPVFKLAKKLRRALNTLLDPLEGRIYCD